MAKLMFSMASTRWRGPSAAESKRTMARNVEIKARLSEVEQVTRKAQDMADSGPIAITQDDTFFRCDAGRLKLRRFSADQGELIFYRRPDQRRAKESFYLRSCTDDPAGLKALLAMAYGQNGRVRKQRTLFMVGRTRIHLDQVEGLGDFVELEVVLDEEEAIDAGLEEAEYLMAVLGINASDFVEGAYVDLLAEAGSA